MDNDRELEEEPGASRRHHVPLQFRESGKCYRCWRHDRTHACCITVNARQSSICLSKLPLIVGVSMTLVFANPGRAGATVSNPSIRPSISSCPSPPDSACTSCGRRAPGRPSADGRVPARVFLLTGGLKPPPTGSGLPDRFDRLPVKTGQIQNRMFNQFRSAYRPV